MRRETLKTSVVLLFVILLFIPTIPQISPFDGRGVGNPAQSRDIMGREHSPFIESDYGGTGSDLTTTAIMSRAFSGGNLSILNTYGSPDEHNATIDLSDYQIPGWTLYNVTIDIESLVAAPERETVGVNGQTWDFKIEETGGSYWTQLAQGFYDQPYNGSLQNYSLYYSTARYDPVYNNYAYFVIRRAYNNDTSNVTSYSTVPAYISGTWHTENIRVNLTADDTYYLIIDGRQLIEHEERFPEIEWRAESVDGDFNSYKYMSPNWNYFAREALLNYTYIPWNQTSNSPLLFNASEVSLRANQTPISGNRASFETPGSNITLLHFDSNQSVYMLHNMTLRYSKSVTATTLWDAPEPGQDILWNQTVTLEYPSVQTGVIEQMAVLSKMPDWTVTGLYNGTSTESYEHYSASSTTVFCSDMTNGTWTMTSTAPNYVTAIDMSDSVSEETILENIDITKTLFINSTLIDTVSDGNANLTIYHQAVSVYTALNATADDEASFHWDISESTSNNGLYTLDVFWSNGTESGYLSVELVVFYPTTLTPAESSIDAFTDDNFDISVYFNDTFTPQGLTGGDGASVTWYFDGDESPLLDHGNGTWTATVSTAGKSDGTYDVYVVAEGFALENQTINIPVTLIYETQSLDIIWSNTDTIEYLEHTTLSVGYYYVNGTPVDGATLNVTDGTNWWNLTYDAISGRYNHTFKGIDDPPGIGSTDLTIYAWELGHEEQTNSTQTLTISLATTSLDYDWLESFNITYIESTILWVNYTLANGTAIEDAWVNVTIGADTWNLTWDAASERYNYTFQGTDDPPGFGNHVVEIQAWKFGYQDKSQSTSLTIREEPTELTFNWKTNTIHWTDSITLEINYTDSNGVLIESAETKQVFINGTEYELQGDNGTYWFTFNNSLDLGRFEIAVNLSKYGYAIAYDSSITLDIIPEPTTLDVTWTPANLTIEFTDSFNLTVDYTYSSGDVPETGTMVNVTIDGTTYHLTYNGSHWYVTINGSDLGVGNYTATILADCYGYEDALDVTAELNVTPSPNMFDVQYEPSDYIMTYAETLNITVYYLYEGEPVENATVRLYVNSSRIYDLILGMDENWHISLAASDIGLGSWNLTILANSSGYDTGREEVLLEVQVDTPVLTPSWSEHDLYYTHETEFTVTLVDSLGNPILDAEVNATYRSQNYTLTHEGLGAYTLQFDGSDGLGSFTIAIRSWVYGFENLTDSVLLNIIETPLLDPTIEEIYYGFNGSVFVELFYDGEYYVSVDILDVDSKPVNTLTVNVTIDGEIYPLVSVGGGSYSTTIAGSAIGVGSFAVLLQGDVYGYESFSETLNFDVIPVPTQIQFTEEAPSVMFLNDTFDLILNFTDGHTGDLITAGEIMASFANPVTLRIISEGVYSFEISTFSLPLTSHLLNITFLKTNYTSISYSATITVRAVHTALTGNTEYFEWENETMVFAVQFHDLDHDVPVHWASVRVSFSSIELNMSHAGEGIYEVEYRVLLAPNTYDLTFTAEAVGCGSQTLSAQLEVRAKTNLYFVFDLPESVAEGSSFSVGATLLVAGTDEPFDGVPVKFYVHVILDDDTELVEELNAVTNLQGYASQAFTVPSNAVNVTVVAVFQGTRQVWSVEEQSGTIPVTPGVITQFIEFLTRPPGLYMVLVIAILGVVAGAYNKIHKPRKAHEKRVLQRQLNAFHDLQTLRHFMAVYLDRGTCVFYHPFTDTRIQPDLISGFIAAITSVYGEIKGDGVSGTLEEIQYQGLWLNSYSSQYVIGILILEGETSPFLRERLQFFVEMFENQYESHLTDWKGAVDCFDPEWVIGNLNETFNYNWMLPHIIVEREKARGFESEILKVLSERLDEKDEFRIADVLEPAAKETGKTEAEILDVLLEMQEKGLIRPISIHTVLQRQGLGILGEEEGEIEMIGGEEAVESVEEEPAPVSETPSDMRAEEPSEQDEDASDEKEPEKDEDEAEKFIKDVEALMSPETDDND